MGKHTQSKSGSGVTAAIVAGVLVFAGGGAWAMGSILGDDSNAAAATPTASSTATGTPSVAAASPSTSATTAAASDPAATAKAACVTQVAAADRIAKAAANSALHWKQHTEAFTMKEAGKITLEQTKKIYADSKAFGLADEKEFAAATKEFTATGAACSDAAKVAPANAEITACTTRLAALDGVRTTGTKVQDQWSAHMRMMADKSHTDAGAYHQRWLSMVAQAGPTLTSYNDAATKVAQAPACA